MVLDMDVVVASVLILPGGELSFLSDKSHQLDSGGNVEVRGSLVMRPSSANIRHVLRFVDIDESRFVGGGDKVLASDAGLWIVEGGLIDLAGSTKCAWTRVRGDLLAGATQVKVTDAAGWLVGDTLVFTPTTPPTPDNGRTRQDVDHCLSYDEAKIATVNGTSVTLDRPLLNPHPSVHFADWNGSDRAYGAEVLNLSRNVVVGGTPGGRAHISFLATDSPQLMSHVEISQVGPRQSDPEHPGKTRSVLGRYGVHLHHCNDGSRGSQFEGVVVHDSGGHAFVPHQSHGTSFTNCVAHDVGDTAFWWDLPGGTDEKPVSHDTVWKHCLASKVVADSSTSEGYRLAGFSLGDGADGSNHCIDCVAVAVHDEDSVMSSAATNGFHWPSSGPAVWVFSGCLSHNIGGSGLLVWQNVDDPRASRMFTAYHCGRAGIEHGAYSNRWQYADCALYANRRSGIALYAVTRKTGSTPADAPPLTFQNVVIDGGGVTANGVRSEVHTFPALDGEPVVLSGLHVTGCREVSVEEPPSTNRTYLRLVDCHLASPEFFFSNVVAADTLFEVVTLNDDPASFVLRRKDRPGVLVLEWNARRASARG